MKPTKQIFPPLRLPLIFLQSLLFLPCSAQTIQSAPNFSAKVQLLLTCTDESLKNQFISFLGRELRSLGDVTLVDENADYVIELIVMKVALRSNEPAGFAVATYVSEPVKSKKWLTDCSQFPGSCLTGKVDDRRRSIIEILTNDTQRRLFFQLQTGSLDNMRSTCQDIIADFDVKTLQPNRNLWNQTHKQTPGKE